MIQALWKKKGIILSVIALLILCNCAAAPVKSDIPPTHVVSAHALIVTPKRELKAVEKILSIEPLQLPDIEVEVIEETLDRNEPIYEVYKYGQFVENATVEIQWIIRDMCTEYDLPEKMIYGMITVESTFCTNAKSYEPIKCYGLAQINKFWITGANITHFTDDYRERDLCDPYDNMLTLAEMMCYARDTYHLDLSTREGQVKYLYWHNTGCDPTHVSKWSYATTALGFADELVTLQS